MFITVTVVFFLCFLFFLNKDKLPFAFFFLTQVCDSDTMLDPASSVEMVKVLEEDPMVGGVGGDVQVSQRLLDMFHVFAISSSSKPNLTNLLVNSPPDPEQV